MANKELWKSPHDLLGLIDGIQGAPEEGDKKKRSIGCSRRWKKTLTSKCMAVQRTTEKNKQLESRITAGF